MNTLEKGRLTRRYAKLTDAEVAREERDRVLTAVKAANPSALDRALALIVTYRDEAAGELFSANDLRAAFDAAAIPSAVRGAAFQTARKRHLIEGRGWETSTDKGTHAKRIELYGDPFGGSRRGPVSAHPARGAAPRAADEVVEVPVVRDRGRFASHRSEIPGQGDLLAGVQ